ncbi:MAG: glycosyltransferase [Candidatus Methylacidiphilales bacterium]|nr:glycosyltransferase [Candidatus Methylacidiphilales bacterium]
MNVSVILPAHQPHRERLARTLEGLASQSLPIDQWQLLIIDNASQPPLAVDLSRFPGARIIAESRMGLSHARRTGVRASSAEFLVFVDDDNLLAPDYLESALDLMRTNPQVGAAGGASLPEFEAPPPDWSIPHHGLLALRDLGNAFMTATWNGEYPACAPIGAGMVLRRSALGAWLNDSDTSLTDRCGKSLASGGDNDIVLHVLKSGWEVAYSPGLRLTHLIPASRLEPAYLARLHESMQASWMRVLTKHGCNPWFPIPRWTLHLRQWKAYFSCRAWEGPSARISWHGACGHFAGRIPL